ncbi:transcription activator MBF2 domain-containing protein [Phthorimaea operculella]|nr:transcription activator MBF2 domain-containing protein [Phthorimaea operculella]
MYSNHLFFLLFTTILQSTVYSYDLYDGYEFGARMSYREVKKHGLLFFVRQETVVFEYPQGTNITGIAISDISENKLGIPRILEGGVGHSFVKIHLESERSTGLKFIIEIYASSFKVDLDVEDNHIRV